MFDKALTIDDLYIRPTANSRIISTTPKLETIMMKGTRNAPPPFSPTMYGNLQIFPIPTAEPIQANRNPKFEFQTSVFASERLIFLKMLMASRNCISF